MFGSLGTEPVESGPRLQSLEPEQCRLFHRRIARQQRFLDHLVHGRGRSVAGESLHCSLDLLCIRRCHRLIQCGIDRPCKGTRPQQQAK